MHLPLHRLFAVFVTYHKICKDLKYVLDSSKQKSCAQLFLIRLRTNLYVLYVETNLSVRAKMHRLTANR